MGIFDKLKQVKDSLTADNVKLGMQSGVQSTSQSMMNPQDIAADAQLANEYGQELQRLQREGTKGTGVIKALRDVEKKAPSGSDWKVVETEITISGQDPYVAVMEQLVPSITADQFQPGARYAVAVDPADPNKYAFTGPVSDS